MDIIDSYDEKKDDFEDYFDINYDYKYISKKTIDKIKLLKTNNYEYIFDINKFDNFKDEKIVNLNNLPDKLISNFVNLFNLISLPKITINYKNSGLYLNIYDIDNRKRLSHLSLHKNFIDTTYNAQIHLKIGRSFQGLYKILLKENKDILLWLIPDKNNIEKSKKEENFDDLKLNLIDLYTILLNKILKNEEL